MTFSRSKKAVVIHSGGMDSSICLRLAILEFGSENVLSLSFSFGQRHQKELEAAKTICSFWNVEHLELPLSFYSKITQNALMNSHELIVQEEGKSPNTLVVGRNGLFARIGAILCDHVQANALFLGVLGLEEENSGYRDCSREYMDLMEKILRIDLARDDFQIRTPLVHLTKVDSLELANSLGVLPFLLENTVTCYEGIPKLGCGSCPACSLRNKGLEEFKARHPEAVFSY